MPSMTNRLANQAIIGLKRLRPGRADEAIAHLKNRTQVFSFNAGRSGSKTLHKLLSLAPEVAAYHEGKPGFHTIMSAVQSNPALAVDFLRYRKIPFISGLPQPIYAETSHFYSKGFFLPTLALGLRPKIICLRREFRQIATSLHRIGAVPGREKKGRAALFVPDSSNLFLPLQNPKRFDNYQLCYWYTLEMAARDIVFSDVAQAFGCPCHVIKTEQLNELDTVRDLFRFIGASVDKALMSRLKEIIGTKFNRKQHISGQQHQDLEDYDFTAQEEIVRSTVSADILDTELLSKLDQLRRSLLK